MTLPKEAELLGTNSGELELKGSGASTVVKLSTDGQRRIAALVGGPSASKSSGGVYVGLDGLRRASTLQGENKSPGLTFLLDITQILTELLASKSLDSGEIRVSIV